jgi:hypothetical protein
MDTAEKAIRDAEKILPGVAGSDTEEDSRWQAIIRVAEFAESNPEELWAFARHWGSSSDKDLRTGIATCLLEHLLEYHFEDLFPRVESAAKQDAMFADTFMRCWQSGMSAEPANAALFDALKTEIVSRAS